jgi:hypothetical protein
MTSIETYREILTRHGFKFAPEAEDPLGRFASLDHPSTPKLSLNAILTSASLSGDATRLSVFSTFGSSAMQDGDDDFTIAVNLDNVGDARIAEGIVEAITSQFTTTDVQLG